MSGNLKKVNIIARDHGDFFYGPKGEIFGWAIIWMSLVKFQKNDREMSVDKYCLPWWQLANPPSRNLVFWIVAQRAMLSDMPCWKYEIRNINPDKTFASTLKGLKRKQTNSEFLTPSPFPMILKLGSKSALFNGPTIFWNQMYEVLQQKSRL